MTKQEIIDLFKEQVNRLGNISRDIHYAHEYVMGDDSKVSLIPQWNSLWGVDYNKKIIAELDGENSETAMRCLQAVALIRRKHLFSDIKEIKLLKRIGFGLEFIMGTEMPFVVDYNIYMDYANVFMETFPEEAETLISPNYLSLINSGSKMTIIAYFIASKLVSQGKNTVSNGLSLSDMIYAHYRGKGGTEILYILSEVYRTESRFTERLKQELSHSGCASTFSRISGFKNKMKEVMYELGLQEEYLFDCAVGALSDEEKAEAKEILSNDEEKLAEIIGKVNNVAVEYLANLVDILLVCLKDGRGKKCLEVCEKKFGLLCGAFGSDRDYGNIINMTPHHFMNSLSINPDKLMEELEFTNHSMLWSVAPIAFQTIVSLVPYSELAHKIIFTLMKSAEKQNDLYGMERFSEMQKLMCLCYVKQGRYTVKETLDFIVSNGISIKTVMKGIAVEFSDYSYTTCNPKVYRDNIPEFVKVNIDDAISIYDDIKNNINVLTYWEEVLYKKSDCKDTELILKLLQHKSKVISKLAVEIIDENEESMRSALENALSSLKGENFKRAKNIIKKWDNERKYGADFEFSSNEMVEEFVSQNYEKDFDKKISFISDECFNGVRYADLSAEASPLVMKYIFGEYMQLEAPFKVTVCSKIANKLHTPDLQKCIENIYQNWIENGSDTKVKMVVVPYCVFASDTQILAMKKQLLSWAEASRGALASFVVNAIAINGGSPALMMINDISVKFPNKMVKESAKSAFEYASEVLGVPVDVLADKIVPNLGLDQNGEVVLDYGSRTFTVSLMPDFSLSFYDNSKGKSVKSLPKASADDDVAKAEIAKKYVSDLKKQLKAVTASQKLRLENVFSNGRTWNVEAWNELFVMNPVMHKFARTLIWGIYNNGRLEATFRYSDDGTFCDMNDDEFELPENAEISLVHPIELDDESINNWNEQLGDYEIVQPFAQITANSIILTEKDIDDEFNITKYKGRSFSIASISSAVKKYNMIRSSVEDGGGFSGYHIQDKFLGYGMAINGEFMYVGQSYDEVTELGDVYFYKLTGDAIPDSYNDFESCNPSEISRRFVSCCLNILEGILE